MLKIGPLLSGVSRDPVKALQVYQLSRQSALIAIAVLLAKSHFTTEQIGIYELLLFLGTVVSFFWVDAILKALLAFFPEQSEHGKRALLWFGYCIMTAMALMLCAILFFAEGPVSDFILSRRDVPFYRWYTLFLVFYLPAFLNPYVSLLRERPMEILAYAGFTFCAHLAAIAVPFVLQWSFDTIFYGLIIYGLIAHIWLVVQTWPFATRDVDVRIIRNVLVFMAPLVLYAMATGIARLFDSWLVSWYYQDDSIFAIFRYGAREFPLSLALVGGVTAGMLPQIVRSEKPALTGLRKRTKRLMHLLFPVSIALLLTSPWLFRIFFNVQFVESATIFNVYLLLLLAQLLLPHTLIMARKETRVILFAAVLELVINILLSLLLIRSFGLAGVALATVIAYLAERVFYIVYVSRTYGYRLSDYLPVRIYLLYSAGLIIAFGISLWLV